MAQRPAYKGTCAQGGSRLVIVAFMELVDAQVDELAREGIGSWMTWFKPSLEGRADHGQRAPWVIPHARTAFPFILKRR